MTASREAEGGASRGGAWLRLLVVIVVVVVVDQVSKEVVIDSLEPGERVEVALGVDLARVSNSGIAFGLLGDASGGLVLAITAASLALIVAWFAFDPLRSGMWLAIGLLVGGALGNLADRIREQAVTDFIDPPLWPAFNLADVAITAGAVTLVVVTLAGIREPR